jgi:hypothetical protein
MDGPNTGTTAATRRGKTGIRGRRQAKAALGGNGATASGRQNYGVSRGSGTAVTQIANDLRNLGVLRPNADPGQVATAIDLTLRGNGISI